MWNLLREYSGMKGTEKGWQTLNREKNKKTEYKSFFSFHSFFSQSAAPYMNGVIYLLNVQQNKTFEILVTTE